MGIYASYHAMKLYHDRLMLRNILLSYKQINISYHDKDGDA